VLKTTSRRPTTRARQRHAARWRFVSQILLVVVVLAASSVGWAEGPRRVADLEDEPTLQRFVFDESIQRSDGLLFFGANTLDAGRELWVTDGTHSGTGLVIDLFPGSQNSAPTLFTAFQGRIHFVANSLAKGRALWISDGTAQGTEVIYDPPSDSSNPIRGLAATENHLFFDCDTPEAGDELCAWDGIAVKVFDLEVGSDGSSPRELARVSDTIVCFSARVTGAGREPWCSDGTVVGTDLLDDLEPGVFSSNPEHFAGVGGYALFQADVPSQGKELVRVNVGSGSTTVFDLNPSGDSEPEDLMATADGVFFTAKDNGSARKLGYYDHATGQATLLDLGFSGSAISSLDSNRSFALDGNRLFLRDINGRLWVSDGSQAGTAQVYAPGVPMDSVDNLKVDGIWLYYDGRLDFNDGLWRHKTTSEIPTSEGPEPLMVVGEDVNARVLGTISDAVIFTANLQGASPESRFRVDAGGGGPAIRLSEDVVTTSSNPRHLTPIPGGGVVFQADLLATGAEAWRMLPGGDAELLEDLNPGTAGSSPREFAAVDASAVLFTTSTSGGLAIPDEPYLWDGAAVSRIDLVPAEDSEPGEPLAYVDGFLLTAEEPGGDRVIWSIRADPVSTNELPVSGDLRGGLALDSVVVFGVGSELWGTDGTPSGTQVLAAPVSLRNVAPIEGGHRALVLSGCSSVWLTDGTVAGTAQTATLPLCAADIDDDPWVPSGGRVATVASVPDGIDYELVVTDGTPAGTGIVTTRELDGAEPFTRPVLLGSVPGGWVYADTWPDSGEELWFTDGVNPPVLIELWPGPSSSSPQAVGRIDDLLYFRATTPARGEELWQTDGTAQGTMPAMELHPGPASEPIFHETISRRVLYFQAIGPGGDGHELWAWSPVLFEDGFESGSTATWSAPFP
jgi:ELWxxDGT repeat protein